jgi:hypothetical protein
MPRAKSRRSPARRSMRRLSKHGARLDCGAPIAAPEEKPVRGVKLKTVSAFTMIFALLCLFAFMAGRVDVAAMDQQATAAKARTLGPKPATEHKRGVAGRIKSGTPHERAVQASF